MKKTGVVAFIITVLLVAAALLSFTECVTVTHHAAFNAFSGEMGQADSIVTQERYSPVFLGVLTLAELILLWAIKKRFTCWIGILLNITATAGPCVFMTARKIASEMIAESIYDYRPAYNEYRFALPVYLILLLGCAVTVLYIILFRWRKNELPVA
ncbi:MAG: hypothetical protein IJK23_06225 [Clostridia bacterium]|nr:hypothetical protein [Clostridia bacterium]